MTKGTKLERDFQSNLIKALKKIFVGCLVMKLDSSYIQGIPDLLILYKNKWATLECKKSASASKRPNQEYYVGLMNKMSFSRFINSSLTNSLKSNTFLVSIDSNTMSLSISNSSSRTQSKFIMTFIILL